MSGRRFDLLISDVDGTLVTNDKVLTPETVAAVERVRDAGIAFAITSSRPPRGMAMLIEPLAIDTPLCAFNGGLIVHPDLRPVDCAPIRPEVARTSLDFFTQRGVQTWLFDAQNWYAVDPDAEYVPHERRTVAFEPTIVPDLSAFCGAAFKIVGVSSDFDALARHEEALKPVIEGEASVVRSQRYYLDITDLRANKGRTVRVLSKRLGIAPERIAVIGDGFNDVAMFREAGFAIAMGNAAPSTQAAAGAVTASNQENGFAQAVARYILGGEQAQDATA